MKNTRITSFYKRIIPLLLSALICLDSVPMYAYAATDNAVDTVSSDIITEDSYDTVDADQYDGAGEDYNDSVIDNTIDLSTGLRPLEFVKIDSSDIDPDAPSIYLDLTGDEPEVSYSGFEEEIYSDNENVDNLGGAVYVDDYWDQYTTYYSYNQMNDKEKALYNSLSKVCITALTTGKTYNKSGHGFTVGNVSFSGLSSGRAMNIGQIFIKQNPQYYFLNGWVGWSGYSGSSSGNLQLYGYPVFANGQDRTEVTSKIRSQLDSWMSQVRSETTVLGKEKKAHDLLIGHTSYAFGTYDQSVYSAIVERQTVCSGYSGTMMMLLNAAGFDSEVVCSSSHAWNTVRLNGTWYYLDATWNDTGYSYNYFNLSDNEIIRQDSSGAHTAEPLFKEFLPIFTRSNGGNSLPEAYGKLDAPQVAAALKSGSTYTVTITGADTSDVWYTISTDGSAPNPGSSYSKSKKYTKPFDVKYGTSVKVRSEKYDYLDSDVVECTRWVRSCKITYNLSKGVNDSRNPAVFMSDDEPFMLYAPTKEGYSFDGWYTDKKFLNKVTTIIPENYNSNLQLYAKWLKDCIILSENLIFLSDGETATINARLAPETAVDKTISWKTDDSTALSVISADNGKITVRASASDVQKRVVITATNPNVSTPAECIVMVKRKTSPDRIVFNKSKIDLKKGDETGLILTVDPSDAVYDSITYSSSSTAVASVSSAGTGNDRYVTVKALSPGETVISARIKSSKGDLTRSCTVTVSGDETKTSAYTDTRSAEDIGKTFWIGGIDTKGYAYTGKPVKPDVRVYMGDHALDPGKDYTISYKNNTKLNDGSVPSKAPSVTVKFIGNYKGTLTKNFKIIDDPEHAVITEVIDISKLGEGAVSVQVDKAIAAKGGSKPSISVKIRTAEGVKELKEGRDYKTAYSSNTSVAKQGKVKITGMGDYKGSLTVPYDIATQSLRNLNMSIADFYYSKSKNAYKKTAVTITDLDGKTLKAGTDYTVEYEVADKSNTPAVGTDIYVTVTGKGNYTDAIYGVISVMPKTIAKASAAIYESASYSKVQKNFTYTGSYIEPHYIRLNIGTAKAPVYLTEGVDFEVAGYMNNIDKGKASVILRGIGEYGGIKAVDYNITVRNVND